MELKVDIQELRNYFVNVIAEKFNLYVETALYISKTLSRESLIILNYLDSIGYNSSCLVDNYQYLEKHGLLNYENIQRSRSHCSMETLINSIPELHDSLIMSEAGKIVLEELVKISPDKLYSLQIHKHNNNIENITNFVNKVTHIADLQIATLWRVMHKIILDTPSNIMNTSIDYIIGRKVINEPINQNESIQTFEQMPVQVANEVPPSKSISANKNVQISRATIYEICSQVTGLLNILVHNQEMSSSQYDRALVAYGIELLRNIDECRGALHAIAGIVQHHKLTNNDIIDLIATNIHYILQDIPLEFINTIKDMFQHHHIEHIMFDMLICFYPCLAELKIIHSLCHAIWGLFDHQYIMDTNVQGLNVSFVMHKHTNFSFKSGVYTIYYGEINDQLFDIHLETPHYRNRNDATDATNAQYLDALQKNAYMRTGLPWEVFCSENKFNNEDKCMYDNFKDARFLDRLLHNWENSHNNMTAEELFLYEDFINGGKDKTWWEKHKHENPIEFLLKYLKFHNLKSMTPEEFVNFINKMNNMVGKNIKTHDIDYEKGERSNMDYCLFQYSRFQIMLYANFVMLKNDISIGNFASTGISSINSLLMNGIVYLDKEYQNFKNNQYKYFTNKLSNLLSTYKQIWVTNAISNHISCSLLVITPWADKLVGLSLQFVNANISMMTSLFISYMNVKTNNNKTGQALFNIVSNSIQVNISVITNYIVTKIFMYTGLIASLVKFIPATIILGSIRIIKYHTFDKYTNFYNSIKRNFELLDYDVQTHKINYVMRIRRSKQILRSERSNSYRRHHAKNILRKSNIILKKKKRKR